MGDITLCTRSLYNAFEEGMLGRVIADPRLDADPQTK